MSRLVVMDLDEMTLRVMKELKDHPALATDQMLLKQPMPTASERGALMGSSHLPLRNGQHQLFSCPSLTRRRRNIGSLLITEK